MKWEMCLEEKKNTDLVEITLKLLYLKTKFLTVREIMILKWHILIQKTEQKIPAPKSYWDILTLETYFSTGHKKMGGQILFQNTNLVCEIEKLDFFFFICKVEILMIEYHSTILKSCF